MNAVKGVKERAGMKLVLVFALALCSWMPAVGEDAMTNDDVVSLVSAGLSDEVIIAKIESSQLDFDTSVDALVMLAEKHVSNEVIAAIVASGEARSSSTDSTRSIGSLFSDALNLGGEGPQMVVIPAGQFQMGCVLNDGNCEKDQMPPHQVMIAENFAMSVHEITFADWDTCLAKGGCNNYRPEDRWGRYNQPVNYVSWEDAKAYVAWLSESSGEEYRLPSEAEWEYAARAGASEHYSWGSTPSNGQANCRGCGSRFDDDATAPVGSFPANAFGLHDVHGNVWEWVEDCWNESYIHAPADGSAWMKGQCSKRILRGGAWSSNQLTLRSAYRANDAADGRGSGRGFRVARTLR